MKVDPLSAFTSTLPHHDRETLLNVLEVAKSALILDCNEKQLFDGLLMALWQSIKVEELK